jgi:putative aldouronate transport system substrate-binding protein
MKKRKAVGMLSMLLASAMILGGCGGGAGNTGTSAAGTAGGEETSTSEAGNTGTSGGSGKVTDISVMVYERGTEYKAGMSTADNTLTQWMNQQLEPLGVHVTFIPIVRSGADDAVNVMLAGGTAPDVIMTYDLQRVSNYGGQGGLIDLNPYVDRLDPQWLEKYKDDLKYVNFDGNQYGLPRVFEIYGKSHSTYLRQDLVEGAGKQMPTNVQELIDVLYAIKDKYPDIIPWGFGGNVSDAYFVNFLMSYTSRANERDNFIYEPTFTRILKPGGKDGLKEMNQLVLDGIISPNFMEDIDNTKYLQDIANGKIAFCSDNVKDPLKAYATATDPDYHMVAVDLWKNLDGSYEVPSQLPVSNYVYVPKIAESKIDAVMTYLNWISNYDNSLNVQYEIIGVGSEKDANGIPVMKSKEEEKAAGVSGGGDFNMLMRGYDFGNQQRLDSLKVEAPKAPEDVLQQYLDIAYSNYFDPESIPSSLKCDQYVPLLQTMIVQFVSKVMLAPEGQFDAVYDQEYKILLDNHLQEVLDERAAWYDANHK